jgi:uncharacterized protein
MGESTGAPGSLTAPAHAAPVAEKERVVALDVLRGVAVLGILLMNIVAMGLPWWAYMNPAAAGGAEGANFAAWAVNETLFEGTMRTIFSLLFGAGVVLMTSRAEARGEGVRVADIYYRRTILLMLFGAIHAYLLLWVGEILWLYGVAGMFLFPLRHWPARRLITLGVVVIAGYSVISSTMDHLSMRAVHEAAAPALAAQEAGEELTEEQHEAIEALEAWRAEYAPAQEMLDLVVSTRNLGYLGAVAAQAGEVMFFHTIKAYAWGFWDVISMMLIGMGLLKLGVLTAKRSTRFYLTLIALGYGLGVPLNIWETNTIIAGGFAHEAFVQAGWTYDLGRLLVALGHIGLVMLLVRFVSARLLAPLAAVGRMALTNYLMHSVIAMFVFYGFGLGLYGQLERWQLYLVVGAVWAFQLIASPLWLKWFRFGPAEWVWRCGTYGEWVGIRRGTRPGAVAA